MLWAFLLTKLPFLLADAFTSDSLTGENFLSAEWHVQFFRTAVFLMGYCCFFIFLMEKLYWTGPISPEKTLIGSLNGFPLTPQWMSLEIKFWSDHKGRCQIFCFKRSCNIFQASSYCKTRTNLSAVFIQNI